MSNERILSKVYYSTDGYWKGYAAIPKLAEKANVNEDKAKEWLEKQALCKSIYQPPDNLSHILCTSSEVEKHLKALNIHKSPGPDLISPHVLKECVLELYCQLHCVYYSTSLSQLECYQLTGK